MVKFVIFIFLLVTNVGFAEELSNPNTLQWQIAQEPQGF
jgi:hypothetical protein